MNLDSWDIDRLEELARDGAADLRKMHVEYAALEGAEELLRQENESLKRRLAVAAQTQGSIKAILDDAEIRRIPDAETLGKIRGLLHG